MRFFILLLFIGLVHSPLSAQKKAPSQSITLDMGLKVKSRKPFKNGMVYQIEYLAYDFWVQLQPRENGYGIQIKNAKKEVLGTAHVQAKGKGAPQLKIIESKAGLLPLWIFSYSQFTTQNNKLTIRRGKLGDTQYADCQFCCYKKHLDPFVTAPDEIVKKKIEQKKPPKEWGVIRYIPTEELADYYNCVQDCMTTLGGTDCK